MGPSHIGTATWGWGRWVGTAASAIPASASSSRRRRIASPRSFRPAGLSTESAHAGAPQNQPRSRGGNSWRASLPQRSRMRHLPPGAELHRRTERSSRRVPFLPDPVEVGTDPAYALRTATGQYRTTPLRGLWQHAPYFHDGSAPALPAVVDHYNEQFELNLIPQTRKPTLSNS
jgi:hypothetical protein